MAANIALGLSTALSGQTTFFYALAGVVLGMVVGSYPGYWTACFPFHLFRFTFYLEPTAALIMLLGGSGYGRASGQVA